MQAGVRLALRRGAPVTKLTRSVPMFRTCRRWVYPVEAALRTLVTEPKLIDWARLWVWMVGLGLLAPAAFAGAQAPDAESPMADTRLSDIRPALERIQAQAEAQGLPTAWLQDKVAEGLAKHAEPARIAQAVAALFERMQLANRMEQELRLRGADPTRTLLRSFVDALSAGAESAPLAQFAREVADATHSRDAVRRAALTVAELEEHAIEPALALSMSTAAFRRSGVPGLNALRSAARRTPPGELQAALRRVTAGERAHGPGPGHENESAHPGGPPHDDSFGQSHGRGLGR